MHRNATQIVNDLAYVSMRRAELPALPLEHGFVLDDKRDGDHDLKGIAPGGGYRPPSLTWPASQMILQRVTL